LQSGAGLIRCAVGARRDSCEHLSPPPHAQVRFDGVVVLEGCLPPPGAGWGGERREAPVVVEPEAPRRSLRARAERTYVDGEDDPDEFLMSESEEEPTAPQEPAPVPMLQSPTPLLAAQAPPAPAVAPQTATG